MARLYLEVFPRYLEEHRLHRDERLPVRLADPQLPRQLAHGIGIGGNGHAIGCHDDA